MPDQHSPKMPDEQSAASPERRTRPHDPAVGDQPADAPDRQGRPRAPLTGEQSPQTPQQPRTPERRISVLIADDQPMIRTGFRFFLDAQPDITVVAEAADGEEATELYNRHQPDVMVLDLRMPKRDGVAVVEMVLAAHPHARLLVMTTYDGDEDIFRCLSQGAKGYLLKDAPRTEILSAIRAVSEDRPSASSSVASKALQRMAKPSLTQRELGVLQQLAEGRSNKDIARRLSITEGTAKTHVKAILTKLDAISRTEAVAVAHKRGLVRL